MRFSCTNIWHRLLRTTQQLLLLLFLFLGSAAAAPCFAEPLPSFGLLPDIQLHAPDSISQGSPLFVLAESQSYLSGTKLRLYYSDGSLSQVFPAFKPVPVAWHGSDLRSASQSRSRQTTGYLSAFSLLRPSNTAWMAAIHADAALGPASLRISNGFGVVLAEQTVHIQPREYKAEILRLNSVLTSIRADPDPIKDEQARRYQALLSTVDPAAIYLDAPFIMPLESRRRTSFFGDRRTYQYSDGSKAFSMHAGIDYGVARGTPLYAAGRGKVVLAESRIVTGNTIILEHLPGMYSIYMHLDTIAAAVSPGQIIPRGSRIGTVGSTGLSTGPHLHWEVRIMQVAVDPESLLRIDNFPKISTILGTIEGR
ncbi:MAG: M23 family metallopeptidase [Spirochaetes bacterium]|nr:M23 family metallopeptidase [Spirochaetota bacterium]MBU0956736.1 M23 family metallopeptidase [Spirochaetota bacterium]